MSIILKQGLLLKSADGEYIYNIYSYNPDETHLSVDILNRQLETIATRVWGIEDFQRQIDAGTIVNFEKDETIGQENNEAE